MAVPFLHIIIIVLIGYGIILSVEKNIILHPLERALVGVGFGLGFFFLLFQVYKFFLPFFQ